LGLNNAYIAESNTFNITNERPKNVPFSYHFYPFSITIQNRRKQAMSQLVLHLFGTPRLERDGTRVEIHRRKVLALLSYLAVTGKSHPRDSLATMFWSEHDQGSARCITSHLVELQKSWGKVDPR
jgi:two-component SAPR family response regulator